MVFRKLRNLVVRQAQAAASKETEDNQPSSDDEQSEPISVRNSCSLPTAVEVLATVVSNKGHKRKRQVSESDKSGINYPSAKGRLNKNLIFWRELLSANSAVLEIINNGYKIPFFKTPKRASFRNNQSVLKNKDFVEECISELLKCGYIIEAEKPPEVINPLSVSINSSGKKRLILDLRYVNGHVYKDKIKFEDWKYFEHYLEGKKGTCLNLISRTVISTLIFWNLIRSFSVFPGYLKVT